MFIRSRKTRLGNRCRNEKVDFYNGGDLAYAEYSAQADQRFKKSQARDRVYGR